MFGQSSRIENRDNPVTSIEKAQESLRRIKQYHIENLVQMI